MNFYVLPPRSRQSLPAGGVIFPCLVLHGDNWNDFAIQTSFQAVFHRSANTKPLSLGEVKILMDGDTITKLPSQFSQLSSQFCSLGQKLNYYNILHRLGFDIYDGILKGLNDVVYPPSHTETYINTEPFKISLLRYSEAEKAFREARSYFDPDYIVEKKFSFTFHTSVPSAEEEHVVAFNFPATDHAPHRINAIIGKNGTGKTRFLSNLAATLSGQRDTIEPVGRLEPVRPSFSRVIAISYSSFDKFYRPDKGSDTRSYVYCGARKDEGTAEEAQLGNRLKKSLEIIEATSRLDDWKEISSHLIPESILIDIHQTIISTDDPVQINEKMTSLSSGQTTILALITDIIANIEAESILLFDEPDLHLHPNAISNLIRVLYFILDRYDSYSVIATHSPIIIQEIPSRYVRVFDREGKKPIIRDLAIECFGENLSEITNEVFQVSREENYYKEFFDKLLSKMAPKEIEDLFEKRLSLNAKLYLMNANKEKNEKPNSIK